MSTYYAATCSRSAGQSFYMRYAVDMSGDAQNGEHPSNEPRDDVSEERPGRSMANAYHCESTTSSSPYFPYTTT